MPERIRRMDNRTLVHMDYIHIASNQHTAALSSKSKKDVKVFLSYSLYFVHSCCLCRGGVQFADGRQCDGRIGLQLTEKQQAIRSCLRR